MEHVAHGAPAGRAGVEPPRWRTLAWEVVLGYAFALLVTGPLVVAVTWLGIAGRDGDLAYRPRGVDDFPFVANGVWSLSANAFWTIAVSLLCAFGVWGCLRARLVQPVSFAGVLASVVVAGYVPAADVPGLGAGEWPAQFVVALVLVRWLAVGRSFPLHVPVALVGAALALLLPWGLAAAAYGVTHPLSLDSVVSELDNGARPQWNADPPLLLLPAGDPSSFRHGFSLRNRGFADLHVRAIRLPKDAPFRLIGMTEQSGSDAGLLPADGPPSSGAFVFAARSEHWLTLRLQPLGCRPWDRAQLRRVLVDYELFGRRWTQPVPLFPVPVASCGDSYGPGS